MTFLPLADPTFDVTGEEVLTARAENWWVRTSYGYAVLRHSEGSALLRDRRFQQGNARWPEQNGIHAGLFSDWWKQTLLSLEGADHTRLRRLLNPAFSRTRIAALTPAFRQLANELIGAFAARGSCEFISEFAEPYATRVLCRLLGLPEDSWQQIAHWSDDLGRSFGVRIASELPVIEAALSGLTGYCEEVIADRARSPRGDLVTEMVQARDSGVLDHRELAVAMVFLVFAGMETTRNQLGLAVRTLLADPAQWRLLGERPELGEQCVEEVMRVNPTVTWITREAIEDVDFRGLRLAAGDIVQVISHAAGTDPTAMPDPSFDIRQVRPPHLGFGAGIHHCIGHFVARVDMAVALPLLASRFPDLATDGSGEWLPISGNTGAVRFPLCFTPNGS
ncbi:MAG: cytochrome P450 [Nakamurella sp.]